MKTGDEISANERTFKVISGECDSAVDRVLRSMTAGFTGCKGQRLSFPTSGTEFIVLECTEGPEAPTETAIPVVEDKLAEAQPLKTMTLQEDSSHPAYKD